MWAQMAAAAVGIWLMASPSVLGFDDTARTIILIVGPVAVSMAVIAIWEIGRELRWVNVGLGAWLLLSPWVFGYDTEPLLNSLVAGVLLIGLSLIRGEVSGKYGGGWKSLVRDEDPGR